MNNENNNNQNNNYVTPEKVDLNKVVVDKSNEGALNRERDNIISASIQANDAIDEKMAKDVNNTIKVKKKNPLISLLIGVFFVGIACVLAYMGFRLLQGYIKYDDNKHTTTTTTTQKVNYFANYTYDSNKLRKFQNDNSILILLPTMLTNLSRYIYIENGVDGLLKEEEGTYNIKDGTIILVSDNSTQKIYNIEENNLKGGDIILNMYDQEYKYYINKTSNIDGILIVNANQDKKFAYIYDVNTHKFADYTESSANITLSTGEIYTKSGFNLVYNDITFVYAE